MEVVDPFVPSFQPDNSGFGEIPQEWATPFTVSEGTVTVSADAPAEAPVEESVSFAPAPEPTPFAAVDDDGGAVAQAKDFAAKLAGTLSDLQRALDDTTGERTSFLRERAEMQARIRGLEAEAARKEEFKALLLGGAGATLSNEDLDTLQNMTDALTQDPDRLTLLFNVVQQAPKLATAINVFTQLRRLADQS